MSERCPVCALELVDGDPGQRACSKCKGTWIGWDAFAQMIRTLTGGEPTFAAIEPRTARACPTCNESMIAATILDILVDRCPAHGVWTDAGELSRMVLAARRGAHR